MVLLGDGLIEQEQYHGWIELMLCRSFAEHQVTFHNLGWNADTPAGSSRFGLSLLQAGREPPDEGWLQLQKQLQLTRPTVLIVGYGMASGLEQQPTERFAADYERLLQTAREIQPDVRLVCLSPLIPAGASTEQKQRFNELTAAIRSAAKSQQSQFVDLSAFDTDNSLLQDPIHLNSQGYRQLADYLAQQLSVPQSASWPNERLERLRKLVLRKNEWWFHRSRPSNMAYVFGFRKHEQGQNAAEIPQFDQLIEEEEARIRAVLRGAEGEESPTPQLTSRFAKFTEQPLPDFSIADDLEVTLWAQNPDLNKPIHMNFDAQGRLWVASSEAYPMIEVGQSAPDKIIVLADTDADGRADQSTVFAEGLLIPTGVAPGDDGVYVAQSTDLLHLRDTDGDGRADVKRRVLSGFGTEDTHHNLHTLTWGPDGRLYMNQSVYTRTDTETPHGVVRLKAGGGFRFDTRAMKMDIFFRGLWNSWGHVFDDHGQSFLSDGAGFAGIAYAFPGASFNPTPNARYQLDLISPGNWPKFASLEVIYGDTFPDDWQGSLVTCDFRANRVTRFRLDEQGAGFVTTPQDDLLRTSATTFRPIDVKQGPDGALYIADWSNPIINHGEVDFRDERRDRWHGRIWRLAWKKSRPRPVTNLTQLNAERLFELLLSNDRYQRNQARRVLLERPGATLPVLESWTAALSDPRAKLQALWLHQGLYRANLPLAEELLEADDHRVRAATVRVLADWADPQSVPKPQSAAEAMSMLVAMIQDQHPRVRLEAIRALAREGSVAGGLAALQALELPRDRFIDHALQLTVTELAPELMTALETNQWDTATEKQLEFLLTTVEPQLATDYLIRRIANQPISRDGQGPWIELIGQTGNAALLNQLFELVVSDQLDAPATKRALQALATAERLRKQRPSGNLDGIVRGLESSDAATRMATINLIGSWRLRSQTSRLAGLAGDETAAPADRQAAAEALAKIGGPRAAKQLHELVDSTTLPELKHALLFALARTDMARAIEPFFDCLSAVDTEAAALELWRGVLRSRQLGKSLASALPNTQLSPHAVAAGLRATRDAGRDEAELQKALQAMDGTARAVNITPEFMADIVARVGEGNAARGEQIYRRPELACATCHAIGGIGGQVGPDMTSLGASAPVDYLVESLFQPNAKIKEGFHSMVVVTADDQVITGVERGSTPEELVLRDANNREIRLPRPDIVAQRPGDSLMPTGVIERLNTQEQLDLVRFLSLLGKPGRYDATQTGIAREMAVFAGTHRIEQAGTEPIIRGTIRDGWIPVRSLVNGDVPRDVLQRVTKQPINIALVHVYVRANIEVATRAEVTFQVPARAQLWLDGNPIASTYADQQTTAEHPVEAGRHQVLVRLDARELPEAFRLTGNPTTFVSLSE